jgi:hypothetical protein
MLLRAGRWGWFDKDDYMHRNLTNALDTTLTACHGSESKNEFNVTHAFLAMLRFLPTIPHPPDRRPSPARTEAATVVASMGKSRVAEIVPPAIVPVAWRIA